MAVYIVYNQLILGIVFLLFLVKVMIVYVISYCGRLQPIYKIYNTCPLVLQEL